MHGEANARSVRDIANDSLVLTAGRRRPPLRQRAVNNGIAIGEHRAARFGIGDRADAYLRVGSCKSKGAGGDRISYDRDDVELACRRQTGDKGRPDLPSRPRDRDALSTHACHAPSPFR